MTFVQKIALLFTDAGLRNRLLFVIGALAVFRVLSSIPIPGVNAAQLQLFLQGNQFFGLLNLFSGGGLSSLSIMMLGVGPYITASIVMQLLTLMIPRLKQMYQEEGELGRKKFSQYSRLLTLPIALVQGISFLILLERQGILPDLSLAGFGVNLLVIVAGIVSGLPGQLNQILFTFEPSQIPVYLAFLAAALLAVAAIVFITEAERPIPVTYAKRARGMKFFGGASTYLPLRL